eukprot:Nitzschia sp. Nitz4//scaffold302_size22357//16499//17167//NITZ4_008562-RA/size22357-processed-gene-0.9-mRNA-1//1//CDS//3329547041//2767//frame0
MAIILVAFLSLWTAVQATGAWSTNEAIGMHHSEMMHANGSDNDDPEKPFCSGMYMIMAMSGFQWSVWKSGDCLLYFAPSWKLDGSGKFLGAMVYSFLLAVLTEGIHTFLSWIRPPPKKHTFGVHLILSLVYAIDRAMGYIIMLIAMMFSWEMLLSVLLGVMVGRLIFQPYMSHDRAALLLATSTQHRQSRLRTLSSAASDADGVEQPLLTESSAETVRRRNV